MGYAVRPATHLISIHSGLAQYAFDNESLVPCARRQSQTDPLGRLTTEGRTSQTQTPRVREHGAVAKKHARVEYL